MAQNTLDGIRDLVGYAHFKYILWIQKSRVILYAHKVILYAHKDRIVSDT